MATVNVAIVGAEAGGTTIYRMLREMLALISVKRGEENENHQL